MIDSGKRDVRAVAMVQAGCGEGPLWDTQSGCLWWVDIAGNRIHAHDPCSGENRSFDTPCLVSALTRTGSGLLVATAHGVALFDIESGTLSPIHDPEPDLPGNRLNDMAVDAAGRLWAGTMSEGARAPSGGLYRFDDSGVHRVEHGLTVSNGMDWSADGRSFFLVDSAPRCIWQYDIDAAGALSNRRELVVFEEKDGRPDGLCIDGAGRLLVAMCGGGAVLALSHEGEVIDRIALPAPQVTSCTFGGEDLSTLYVTTGTFGLGPSDLRAWPLSGSLFSVRMPSRGRPSVEARWPSAHLASGASCPVASPVPSSTR